MRNLNKEDQFCHGSLEMGRFLVWQGFDMYDWDKHKGKSNLLTVIKSSSHWFCTDCPSALIPSLYNTRLIQITV